MEFLTHQASQVSAAVEHLRAQSPLVDKVCVRGIEVATPFIKENAPKVNAAVEVIHAYKDSKLAQANDLQVNVVNVISASLEVPLREYAGAKEKVLLYKNLAVERADEAREQIMSRASDVLESQADRIEFVKVHIEVVKDAVVVYKESVVARVEYLRECLLGAAAGLLETQSGRIEFVKDLVRDYKDSVAARVEDLRELVLSTSSDVLEAHADRIEAVKARVTGLRAWVAGVAEQLRDAKTGIVDRLKNFAGNAQA